MGIFDGLPVPSDKSYLRDELARIDESWAVARFDSLPHVVHILTSKDRATDVLLLKEQSDVVEEVVDEVVHAYHGGFNKAIQNYSQILRLFSESTEKLGDLKHDLAEAKRSLGTRNKQLHQLWYRSVTLRHIIALLDQIEGIAKVPSRIEKLIADKQFYAAIQVYLQSSLMLEREGLQTVGALQDVRSELTKLRGALFFKILDDLHAHLYNRGEYSSVASSIYERDDDVPTTTAVAASRMSSQPLSRRTRTLKGDSQFVVRGLTNGSHRTSSIEEGSSFDGHDEEDSVEHDEATDSKLLSHQLTPWLSDSTPDEFIEAVRKSDDPLHVKYLQTLVQCLCMLGKVAAAGAIICQKLRPTIHEIIISKIKAHMETRNLSKSACSQGDQTVAAGLHFIKGQPEAYRLSKEKPQNRISNSGTHLAVSPVSPLMVPGGKAQAAAKDLLDSILDTIVKIFENHVVIGELLELKASQHDINTPKSLPTNVNWNTDSEASQVTGGYTISYPLTVLQSECQQLICEILRATPEAASADAVAQTAKVAKKASKKDKRNAPEDGLTFTFRFTDATVSISNQGPPPPHVSHNIPADPCNVFTTEASSGRVGSCKQFWKAGDYEGAPGGNWDLSSGGFDHVRVHPKFLHSNATSHKWALGAFAELLDNALDEVASGATYVNVDMLENKKEGNRMLLIEDNGGGMDPEKMRQCMSLGYSAKSKLANTIGQYGNGFKTSTMRLGADVIVFSRCLGKDGKSSTQSIGLLSYTFLRSTGKEDIVVPMLDYERRDTEWSKVVRSSLSDWDKNVKTIIQWSPFSSEEDLLRQFALMNEHGTRIIIYNLWEDDQGMLELDFDADPHDIQLRGVNRDEKNIKMGAQFPNSRHFLTYKHSLRSYASILYLRIPPSFRIILRGRDVEHHNVVNDMMQTEQITYRPQYGADSYVKDSNMSAVVVLGFVKDAKHHVDVQGFNVYHKNRLIKPFWRIWNATGSDGRGVIGVLEANFVEPAHDKQGFERTTVLSRLETRLIQMQKIYWNTNCHKIGYAPRRHPKAGNDYGHTNTSPENDHEEYSPSGFKTRASDKFYSSSYPNHRGDNGVSGNDSSLYLQEELRRERERSKALEAEVELARQKIEEMSKEQENLISIFTEERDRRDVEEESLRNKLEEASNTIEELLNKIKMLEGSKGPSWRR